MLFVDMRHEESDMAYGRLSCEERRLIYEWQKGGRSPSEIARLLNRNKGTISRELRRNKGLRGYRFKQAQGKASARAKREGYRTFTDEMRQEIETRIRRGHTPEMIQGRVRLEGRPMVCKERIYQYIYADAKAGGDLWEHLPRAKRRRRRRCPRQDGRGRGRIPNQRRIDTRPGVVETRERVGDWEGDLVAGAPGTGHLVTLVERKVRFSLLGRVPSKSAAEVEDCIGSLFSQVPAEVRKTLTLDNGKEFAFHESIAQRNAMEVYFAHPYHSWERGTNENTNGLIRRIHPKGSSFAAMDQAALARIDQYLNDRPRKCLGWQTPREALHAHLSATG